MASFNSTPSAFPRQAVVASATLPPKAPAPSFFGGNTATISPATPVVTPPTPPADTFTATAPDPADAKKAEAAKKENGFVKFAKSPWGIGAGVAAVLGGGLLIWKKPWQGGNTISQLEKVVKDLGKKSLEDNHKDKLLGEFARHLQDLTADTNNHTPEMLEKLSSAIVDVHANHGDTFVGQVGLLHGLSESSPSDLKDLLPEARQAIVNTSSEYIKAINTKTLEQGDETKFDAPLVEKAVEWLLHPHGEGLGIQNADDLVKTSGALASALHKVRPEGERLYDIHKAVLGFSETDEYLTQLNASLSPLKDDEGVALTDINDIRTAGHALFNARLKGPKETEEVLAHLNAQGIGEGYGDLSKPNGFKDLEARLLPEPELPKPEPKKKGRLDKIRDWFRDHH